MDKDYARIVADADEVREFLKERIEIFPYKCCSFAAQELSKKGYEIVAGYVKLDDYCGLGKYFEHPHFWNRDIISKKNIDITASQFNLHMSKQLPDINIWTNSKIYVLSRTSIRSLF